VSSQAIKPDLDKADITLRLYTIRNIANLAADCPESKAEAYILQDVIGHVSVMLQSLIEDIGA
jgi:hypothetical protein